MVIEISLPKLRLGLGLAMGMGVWGLSREWDGDEDRVVVEGLQWRVGLLVRMKVHWNIGILSAE